MAKQPRERPFVALIGALLFVAGVALTALFAAVAIWNLVHGGRGGAWGIFAVTVPVGALGFWLIRVSRVPVGDALNI
ncbi:hypothetical protein [Oerskovia gallyi]|uniref:Major facilitator superfamily (MFS) profile domain-containing protein n=1 Tax=Oerskovia gallyi TaxID=2762226 RepID=A0ABR8V423_9CELL|nr:hypothetical protein [Oerskovia gallyi]MBD7999536.1 hypothetical protein [Oerskovia gallyi]